MKQEITHHYNDPRTFRTYCTECGHRMKAVNDGDDPVRNGCGEVTAYTYFVDYECPTCRNECSVSMYEWRYVD